VGSRLLLSFDIVHLYKHWFRLAYVVGWRKRGIKGDRDFLMSFEFEVKDFVRALAADVDDVADVKVLATVYNQLGRKFHPWEFAGEQLVSCEDSLSMACTVI